ncbi:MAG: low molecular weight phosphotyrosine protein phosphatase [Flavobacteriales bacterium]|nr:low molecular weight phosphotyrosine protein phosphatase [Flavobacteriales bacterium]
MKRVLFVCLGNICRSAMAQGVLEQLSKQNNLNLSVDSAGTSNYHVGEAPDIRMQKKAKEHNINISTQKARQFTRDDFHNFDYIFAMDQNNFNTIILMAKNENERKKVSLLLEQSSQINFKNVPDPYYGNEKDFETVYQILNSTCIEFINTLKNE